MNWLIFCRDSDHRIGRANLGQATMLADPGDYPISTMAPEKVCKGEVLVGTLVCGAPPACSATLQVDCLATAEFKSVRSSELIPASIKSGASIGGVTGIYPSSTAPLAANTSSADLTSFGPTTSVGLYEFFDSAGNVYSATILDGGTITPGVASQSLSSAGSLYRGVTVSGHANLLASNIKSGVTLFGLTGTYPSSGNLLAGASATADLDSATFEAKVKSASSFEFFGPNGTRYTNSGDTDISASNIASSVTIFGTTGTANVLTQCTSGVQATCESDAACRWNTGACEINPWHIRAGITVASSASSSLAGGVRPKCHGHTD